MTLSIDHMSGRKVARSPGRPTTVDRIAVGATALRLWDEHGFDQVTWADIATATGISQRTILRHFTAKEDLAWVAVADATKVLTDTFESARADAPVSEVVSRAVAHSIVAHQEHSGDGALWLRLVSEEAALRASAAAAYQPWVSTLSSYIATRFPAMPAAACRGIASAYQTTAFEALMTAAETDASPAEQADAVARALSWMNFTAPLSSPISNPKP